MGLAARGAAPGTARFVNADVRTQLPSPAYGRTHPKSPPTHGTGVAARPVQVLTPAVIASLIQLSALNAQVTGDLGETASLRRKP